MSDKDKGLTPRDESREGHYLIMDEYFRNGFNGAKAVRTFNPGLTDGSAKVMFNAMSKLDHVKDYIVEKQQELRASTNLQASQVANELITWMYSDATDYLNLSPEQVKELPPEIRRCIQSIKHRKKSYTDRRGEEVVEEVMEVRIIDKTKAVEILNKMMGFYALDNSQKSNTINVENLNVQELKLLANIMKKNE